MLFFSGFHSSKIPVVLLKNTPNIALFIKLMSSTQNYMHRFPLPAVTEDSSKTLKQDVCREHMESITAALFPPFSHFFFSCCGYVLAPASSLLLLVFQKRTSPLLLHPTFFLFGKNLLFQFLSLPANFPYCPLTLLPLLTNGPTVGKHSHHSLPCTWQFLPLV